MYGWLWRGLTKPFQASGQDSPKVRTVEEQGLFSYSGADLGEAGAPVRRGILESTLEIEERICLINGVRLSGEVPLPRVRGACSVVYGRPHMRDPFRKSCIMDEEEFQKIIAARKHSEETRVAQVS
ncbi:hypothetical protein ACLOJK_038879 [Asimina triloba]